MQHENQVQITRAEDDTAGDGGLKEEGRSERSEAVEELQ